MIACEPAGGPLLLATRDSATPIARVTRTPTFARGIGGSVNSYISVAALNSSDGIVAQPDDTRIMAAQRRLSALGFFVEPASAAGLSAFSRSRPSDDYPKVSASCSSTHPAGSRISRLCRVPSGPAPAGAGRAPGLTKEHSGSPSRYSSTSTASATRAGYRTEGDCRCPLPASIGLLESADAATNLRMRRKALHAKGRDCTPERLDSMAALPVWHWDPHPSDIELQACG